MVRTHYDNLQVSRTASDEVIKGAYKYLCQKWHPDKQPPEKRAEAERVMKLVNTAYEALSDPIARTKHDEWIAEQEREEAAAKDQVDESTPSPAQPSRRLSDEAREHYAKAISRGSWPVALLGALIVVAFAVGLLVQVAKIDHWLAAHQTFAILAFCFSVWALADHVVSRKKLALLRKHDDDTLKLLYDQSSRRRMAAIIGLVILVAGSIVAYAILDRSPSDVSTSQITHLQNNKTQNLKEEQSTTENTNRQEKPKLEAATTESVKSGPPEQQPSQKDLAFLRKDLYVDNKCDRPVAIAVAFKAKEGDSNWKFLYFNFESRESARLIGPEGVPVQGSASDTYWFAKSSDGALIWRAKETGAGRRFVINDQISEPFLPVTESSSKVLRIQLVCPN